MNDIVKKTISIVLPAYNESSNVNIVYESLIALFDTLPYTLNLLYINDGSSDDTLEHLEKLASKDSRVDYISFSRNFGHQAAVKAGYYHATGDAVISMDCDMQHPPRLIPELIAKWEEGYEVVYTIREKDKKLSWFKRSTSATFYRVINAISDIKIEDGAADFRLLDRDVARLIGSMSESDTFLRGMVKWVGFKQIAIPYQPDKRVAGESKYTLKKMITLAIAGVTSFSLRPLHVALWIGALFTAFSLLSLPYVIWSLVTDHAAAGWSSMMLAICFFGGVQLMVIGVMGLYIGKIFIQTKKRPTFIISKQSKNNIQ